MTLVRSTQWRPPELYIVFHYENIFVIIGVHCVAKGKVEIDRNPALIREDYRCTTMKSDAWILFSIIEPSKP